MDQAMREKHLPQLWGLCCWPNPPRQRESRLPKGSKRRLYLSFDLLRLKVYTQDYIEEGKGQAGDDAQDMLILIDLCLERRT